MGILSQDVSKGALFNNAFCSIETAVAALTAGSRPGAGLAPREMAAFSAIQRAGVSVALTHVCIAPERIDGRNPWWADYCHRVGDSTRERRHRGEGGGDGIVRA